MNEIESEREVLEKQILNLIMKIDHKVDQIEGTWWKIQRPRILKQSRSKVDGPTIGRSLKWTVVGNQFRQFSPFGSFTFTTHRPLGPVTVHFRHDPFNWAESGLTLTNFHQIKVKSDRNMNKHIGLEEEMSRLNDRISEAAHGVQRNVLISTQIFLRRESRN